MIEFSRTLDRVADDYVLGLLSETEAALFEEVMARDPALAAQVGALHDDLLPLDLTSATRDLPPGFAEELRSRIGSESPAAQSEEASRKTSARTAANLNTPPRRRVLGFIAASIFGLVLGFGAATQLPDPEPMVVAVLLNDAGIPQAVIEDYGNDTAQVRFVANVDLPEDRTLQAWTLPSKEAGPTSLGTLDAPVATLLQGSDLPQPAADQLYEITLEPAGGSPTGKPTGPIIGKGFAALQR